MKNKGFTLVELLGVLVILSVLGILISQNVIDRVKQNNKQLDSLSRDVFISSARSYVNNNTNQFTQLSDRTYCLSYDFLIRTEFLDEAMLPQTESLDAIKESFVEITYDGEKYLYDVVDECENDISPPYFIVDKINSIDRSSVTLEIKVNDSSTELALAPYSFDNGESWQYSNRKTISSSYSNTIRVKNSAGIESEVNYSISKLTVDANEGIWSALDNTSYYWLTKNEKMTITNPTRLQYSFIEWVLSDNSSTLIGKTFTMGNTDVILTAQWGDIILIDATPPICTYEKTNLNTEEGVIVTPDCYDDESGLSFVSEQSSYNKSDVVITAINGAGITTEIIVPIEKKTQYSKRVQSCHEAGQGCYDRDMGGVYSCSKCGGPNCCNGDSNKYICKTPAGCSWSGWSEWSDTPVSASSTVQVKTREVYY